MTRPKHGRTCGDSILDRPIRENRLPSKEEFANFQEMEKQAEVPMGGAMRHDADAVDGAGESGQYNPCCWM